MSDKKVNVFIVDDDALSRMIILDELSDDDFNLFEYSNGKECIDNMSLLPDLVLMDVEMPVMNGYEACRQIKSNELTKDTEVIFISSHDTTEEKLSGYDAGGSDYVIKPMQPSEVKQKISVAIKNIKLRKENADEMNSAMKTAITAISNAGEQGIILDFTRRSYAIRTPTELAKLVVDGFLNFGIDTTVQLRINGGSIVHNMKGSVSPLEVELLSRLKDSGRIQEHASRVIVNYGDVSLLVKNMPEDDDKRGRLRDHIAILLEIADSRLQTLSAEMLLERIVIDAKESLLGVECKQLEQKNTAMHIMDTILADLEEAFMTCGLTEVQEQQLLNIVQTGVDRSLENFEAGLEVDNELKKVIQRLECFTKK